MSGKNFFDIDYVDLGVSTLTGVAISLSMFPWLSAGIGATASLAQAALENQSVQSMVCATIIGGFSAYNATKLTSGPNINRVLDNRVYTALAKQDGINASSIFAVKAESAFFQDISGYLKDTGVNQPISIILKKVFS